MLDLACGSGRHVRWLAAQRFRVTAVDRDGAALAPLAAIAETIEADIESGPWPLAGRRFDAVVITNYLWRPLSALWLQALADGGVYLHETFADGNQHVGKPSRPDFLLQRGELLAIARGLTVVAYEDGWLAEPLRCVQRIAATSGSAAAGRPSLGG